MRVLLQFAIVVVCACSTSSPSTPPPPPTTAQPSNGSADAARVLRDKLVAIDAHISVVKNVSQFAEYRDVLRTVEKVKDVVAAEPFIYGEVFATSAGHAATEIHLKGVDPERVARVLDLSPHMTTGKIQDLANDDPPAIILGDVLADTLKVHAGDLITLTLPADPGVAVAHPFRVTGILHVGFDFYDEGQAYASLAAVQKLMNRGD
ncbi:MAG TPA: ABC transporter permease, partial [Kofleriaceae bacterium]